MVWRHSINTRFYPKTDPHQQSNNTPHHIIPLEGNPSNKLKEPHLQVKCMSEFSILHWNHIHPCLYIHPCFQFISMTIIEIKNQQTARCDRNMQMRWRRRGVEIAEKCTGSTFSLTGDTGAECFEGVEPFKYLGLVLHREGDNWPALLINIRWVR